MTDTTKIEWTDFTVNFWEGCQKVGPGCDHCYAEARDMRFTGGSHWGPGAPRRKVKGGVAKLRKINRQAEAFRAVHGHWPRVFCSSLSDVFDNAVDPAWREEALYEITNAKNCRVQLLTKRVGNVEKMIVPWWRDMGWPAHVGLMITVVNQEEADRDIPKLLDLKARLGIPWVGLSMEPLLGPVDLTWLHAVDNGDGVLDAMEGRHWEAVLEPWGAEYRPRRQGHSDRVMRRQFIGKVFRRLDWIICGGESGRNARPLHPDWARGLRDQCVKAGVAFFHKQNGAWLHSSQSVDVGNGLQDAIDAFDWGDADERNILHHWDDGSTSIPLAKKAAGRLLDGREWNQTPEVGA